MEGAPVDSLFDVKPQGKDEEQLGRARILVGNTPGNRAIASGDEVEIFKNGGRVFNGNVTKKPSRGDNNEELEVVAGDRRVELQYHEAHRPFYNMDSGELIREAIQYEAQPVNSVTILRGDESGSNWDHNIPVFELANFSRKRYREHGSNLVFAGWREGASGTYRATFSGVPSRGIPGDAQIQRLRTRILANNRGDQIRGEVELVDNAGNNYVWDLPQLSTNFEEYELRAEDARTSAGIGTTASGTGVLEYRFRLKGDLSEARAVLIDHAETLPFVLESRDANITVDNVQDTGRKITRRYDASIMEILNELAEEEGFISWVDEEDDLHFEPFGQTTADKEISYTATPVTDVAINRDYDRIVNKLTVQGSGSVQVTVRDNASIQFYGLSAREDQLVDKEIQTNAEARRRGEAVLDDEAWHDTALEFEIADTTFDEVRVGETMFIDWPPEDVQGTYAVSGKETTDAGLVTLSFTGHTGG